MSPNIGVVLENWCATTSSLGHFFVELKNTTTYFATKVGVRGMYIATITECHSICLHNCSCFAFIFHKISLSCIPIFHPQSQFITTSSSLNFVATHNDHSSVFIKLTTSLSPSSQGTICLSLQNLIKNIPFISLIQQQSITLKSLYVLLS